MRARTAHHPAGTDPATAHLPADGPADGPADRPGAERDDRPLAESGAGARSRSGDRPGAERGDGPGARSGDGASAEPGKAEAGAEAPMTRRERRAAARGGAGPTAKDAGKGGHRLPPPPVRPRDYAARKRG